MKNSNYSSILLELNNEIENYERLSINEVHNIVHEINSSSHSNKKNLRDRLIRGTFYILVNHLNKINIPSTIKGTSFDYDDFIQNSILNWINCIDQVIEGSRTVGYLFYSPELILIPNNFFDFNEIKDIEKSLKQYTWLRQYPKLITAAKFKELFEFYCNNKNIWFTSKTEELAERFHISLDRMIIYKDLIEKSVLMFGCDLDEVKLGDELPGYLIYLLYYYSLECDHHNIELTDSYDGEETLINYTLLNELTEVLNKLLYSNNSFLTEIERKVLILRNGLIDGTCHTLEELAERYNVTYERIRQIEAKAVRKLRHPSRKEFSRVRNAI